MVSKINDNKVGMTRLLQLWLPARHIGGYHLQRRQWVSNSSEKRVSCMCFSITGKTEKSGTGRDYRHSLEMD